PGGGVAPVPGKPDAGGPGPVPPAPAPTKPDPPGPGGDPDAPPPLIKPPKKGSKDDYHTVLSDANQKKVNDAVEKGVQFLKSQQHANGGWGGDEHPLGYASLAALTLLECGVPSTDPAIQKAAGFIRTAAPGNVKTYEVSLAILFLDKLG